MIPPVASAVQFEIYRRGREQFPDDPRARRAFYRRAGIPERTVSELNKRWHASQNFLRRFRPDLCQRDPDPAKFPE